MDLARWATFLACGLAAATAAGTARAGEAITRDRWSGAYAGVMGAFSKNVITGTTLRGDGLFGANASQESARVNDGSPGLGAFAGWRRQFDPGFVLGVEADLLGLDHDATNFNLLAASGQPVATVRYETGLLATGRLTAGWSFGDVLVYGTGGAAFGHEKETRTQYRLIAGTSAPQFAETSDATRTGFALGAGAEWRIMGGWSLRVDYQHVRFAKETFRFPDARGGAQGAFTSVQGRIADKSAHMNLVRIGVGYTFGIGN